MNYCNAASETWKHFFSFKIFVEKKVEFEKYEEFCKYCVSFDKANTAKV